MYGADLLPKFPSVLLMLTECALASPHLQDLPRGSVNRSNGNPNMPAMVLGGVSHSQTYGEGTFHQVADPQHHVLYVHACSQRSSCRAAKQLVLCSTYMKEMSETYAM